MMLTFWTWWHFGRPLIGLVLIAAPFVWLWAIHRGPLAP